MEYPRLRRIEAFPVDYQGQRLICLRDPQNLTGKLLLLPREGVFIASLMDGKHSVLDIQEKFMRQFKHLLKREEIEELINQLDDALLLDSDRFREYENQVEEEFKKSSVRESSHAGLAYPDEQEEVKDWLDSYFRGVGTINSVKPENGEITGIIAPHIDFKRGGRSYALAYRELINSDADTFVIFGTSHYATVDNPFILTRKNFRTPLGEAVTDTIFVDKLAQNSDQDMFTGEIFHRQEHSIEFQVVFLQYLFKNRNFKIVPILCNSFYKMVRDGRSPSEDKTVSAFLNSVQEILKEYGSRAIIIAGADMAHVGLKFGDSLAIDESMLKWIRERDHISLYHTESLDAEGFYRSIEEEKDKRKICGLSPIYALLWTIKAEKGKLLDYDQALEPDTGSVVSFASVGFYS